MFRVSLGLSVLLVFVSACSGGVAPDNQREGEVCSDYAYACNVTADTVLICDSSNLWRREAACDLGSSCVVSISETDGESLGCLVDGDEASYPQPFMLFPEPEDTTIEG